MPVAPVVFLLILLSLLAGAPLSGHHYFASTFDASRKIHLEGVVTRVEWSMPHMHFFLDVKDAQGGLTSWACEAGSPGSMSRRGLRRSDLPIGAAIAVDGLGSRDGSRSVLVRGMTLAGGRVVTDAFAGDSGRQ